MASPNRGGGGRDRISELPDGVIGHVLSFLPTKEAARAAALARSWRHKFAYVHTISFVEYVAPFRGDDYTFYLNAGDRRSKNGAFLDDVNAALLCRRRCAGDRNAAPRAFRVHFGGYYDWDGPVVSQWLSHLLRRSGPELHLDLRLQLTVMGEHYAGEPDHHGGAGSETDDRCPVPYSRDVADMFTLPVSLFSCVAIRTLCLGGCDLDPPEIIRLPLLETLLLSSISELDCGGIQRLISCCPRLIDLTLESCDTFTITVLDKHLRRLAIRCCHTLVSVTVDASELREFEYRGAVPAESLVTLHGGCKISSCHIGFCGKKVRNGDFSQFKMFLEQFTATRHLHLVSTHLGSDIESESFTGFPWFPSLWKLELTGYLHRGSIEAVTRILERAPRIEILTMFMKSSKDVWVHPHELSDELTVPNVPIPCLEKRVREINLVHYQGHEAQRRMAKLLFCNARILERACVVFPRAPWDLQTLKKEIERWVVNRSAETIFL
ncbi:hypothetical protein VPH35_026463 [Triticum aestivum]